MASDRVASYTVRTLLPFQFPFNYFREKSQNGANMTDTVALVDVLFSPRMGPSHRPSASH